MAIQTARSHQGNYYDTNIGRHVCVEGVIVHTEFQDWESPPEEYCHLSAAWETYDDGEDKTDEKGRLLWVEVEDLNEDAAEDALRSGRLIG